MGKHIKLPLAGGNWDNGVHAGAFALNVNNASSNSNSNVGGSDSDSIPKTLNRDIGSQGYVIQRKRNIAESLV